MKSDTEVLTQDFFGNIAKRKDSKIFFEYWIRDVFLWNWVLYKRDPENSKIIHALQEELIPVSLKNLIGFSRFK